MLFEGQVNSDMWQTIFEILFVHSEIYSPHKLVNLCHIILGQPLKMHNQTCAIPLLNTLPHFNLSSKPWLINLPKTFMKRGVLEISLTVV